MENYFKLNNPQTTLLKKMSFAKLDNTKLNKITRSKGLFLQQKPEKTPDPELELEPETGAKAGAEQKRTGSATLLQNSFIKATR